MSSLKRVQWIARHELRILLRDPVPMVMLVAMPAAVMAFVAPGMRFALIAEGYLDATGAEQAVPGLTVLFSSFAVTFIAFAFFREHGWRTWSRLRATSARPSELVLGKMLPSFGMALCQMFLLFLLGATVFGMEMRGSAVALAAVALALSAVLVSFGIFLVSFCSSVQQVNAFANIGGIASAGIGGAVTPVSALPDWAQAVAPLTPAYWAMKGFAAVILDGGGLGRVWDSVGVLLGIALLLGALSVRRFRLDEEKTSWA